MMKGGETEKKKHVQFFNVLDSIECMHKLVFERSKRRQK